MKKHHVLTFAFVSLLPTAILVGCSYLPPKSELATVASEQSTTLIEKASVEIATVEPTPILPTGPTAESASKPTALQTAATPGFVYSPTATVTQIAEISNTAVPPPAPTKTPMDITPIAPNLRPLAGTTRFGIWIGGGDMNRIKVLGDSGAAWTRVTLLWSEIEPSYTEPATFKFASYDALLGNLGKVGMNSIVEIRWNPAWAATTLCGPIDKSGGMVAFNRFVKALVERYKAAPYNVKNWEFYNEPDNTQTAGQKSEYCACFGNYPAEYVDLLRTGYSAVKSVDPKAKVLIGGLAFQNESTFNVNFLEQVLVAGAGPYFDVMNLHYYSSQEPAWIAYGTDIGGKVNAARQIMARYGLDKPVAITETGWTSSDPKASDFTEKQARYVPKVLARSLALDLYALIWFSLADWKGADVTYGLTDVNLNPKLSFQTYQMASNEFGDAASVRSLLPSEVGVGSMVEGYSFIVNGQERWVLWAEEGTVQIKLPARPFEARNKIGQFIPSTGDGEPTPFTLDASPIFLRFASP